MIIYHPAYDVYHCSYRIINILHSVDKNEIFKEHLKFIDFYYVYPHLLKSIESLPRPLNFHKGKIDKIDDPFEVTPNPKSLYFDLSQTQNSVVSSLSYKSLIIEEGKKVKLNNSLLPDALVNKFENDEFRKTEIFDVLIKVFPKVTMNGASGIKARSGLTEFRYG